MDPSKPSPRFMRDPVSPRQPQTRGSVQHAPVKSSQLRESVALSASPEDIMDVPESGDSDDADKSYPQSAPISIDNDRSLLQSGDHTAPTEHVGGPTVRGRIVEPSEYEADARTRLLQDYSRAHACGSDSCSHGTFSPRVASPSQGSIVSSNNGFGGRYNGGINEDGVAPSRTHRWFGDAFTDGVMSGGRGSTMSTTKWLAMKHGVKNRRTMSEAPCWSRVGANIV